MSKLFSYENKIYKPKINVWALLKSITYNPHNVYAYILKDHDRFENDSNNDEIFKFCLKEFFKYQYYEIDEFISIIQSHWNISTSNLIDLVEKYRNKLLLWNNRAGLNQILVFQ